MKANSNQPNMLEAALNYARQGFKVIPLCYPTPEGKCGCGWKHKDKNIGKAPRTLNGLNDASSDPDQIREWWKQCPEANIGIVTGPRNGFWVLDIDAKSGGLDSLRELEQEHGKLTTSKYLTGGGGYHFRYRYPQGAKIKTKKVCKGIETRADGAYIVAPPSLHLSGKRYIADEQSEVKDAPAWLMKLLEEPEVERTSSKPMTTKIYEGEGRNQACTREAGRLLNIYKDPEVVKSMVQAYNQKVNVPPLSEDECARTWEKSLAKWAEKITEVESTHQGEAPEVISARALSEINFPELKFALPGMIPEGFTILAGRPKSGKSWWALQAAYSVATGKNLLDGSECERGGALVLGLEDGKRRLQYRVNMLNDSISTVKISKRKVGLHIDAYFPKVPEGLNLAIKWPKIGDGGIERLEEYLDEHHDTRLVVIDIIKRIVKKKGKGPAYEEDYESIQPLQELATRRRVAIIGVHHTRKALADDPIEMVSGTFGLTGGADSVIVVQRVAEGESKFSFSGKDIEMRELAMRFNEKSHTWTCLGEADSHFVSDTRKGILECLGDGDMLPSELARRMNRKVSTIQNLLLKMLRDGQVTKDSRGRYTAQEFQMDDRLFRKEGG